MEEEKIPFRGAQHRVSLINFQYLSFQLVLANQEQKLQRHVMKGIPRIMMTTSFLML